MALSIGTNNRALNAAAAANSVNRSMEVSMERLSTGKRINSASDDAAGVAISSRLTAEVRGTNQSIRNALDGQALIATAEGAHKEVENILQRMREVAVQAANDTNNTQDSLNLQSEMDAMVTEIDRIAGATTWANTDLLAGTGANAAAKVNSSVTFSFQVGAATGTQNQIAVTIGAMDAETLDLNTAAGKNLALVVADADIVGADHDAGGTATTATGNAMQSIGLIDEAIKTVNTQRSKLGAVSNRLNHSVNNLTNMSANLSSAKGRIEDTDYAIETTNLAKNQILQQASTAMLAQANASKQNVLGLLQSG
jgi:flagellin